MSTNTSVTVIVPTLSNVKGLEYLINYFSDKPYPLIIIDNNPKIKKLKRSITYLHSQSKGNLARSPEPSQNERFESGSWVYLPQSKNLGFAKAINLGAKKAKTEWLLFLNDDIEFKVKSEKLKVKSYKQKKDIIEELIKFANKNNLVATSPILVNPNGEVENLGYRVLPFGKVELIKELNYPLLTTNYSLLTNIIDGLTAACLLIKRDVFFKAGGFDERFFAYLEDVDLFLTLKEQGRRFAVYPYLAVLHNHLTTGKTLGWHKNWLDFKNWILVIAKHSRHFRLTNPKNLFLLLIERIRNFVGIIKSLKVKNYQFPN